MFGDLERKFSEMPALTPFLSDKQRAGTSAVTLGLAELIRNIRHYMQSTAAAYKMALVDGELEQPLLRISVEASDSSATVVFRYPVLAASESVRSDSLSRIREFESELLNVKGHPVASTAQVEVLGEHDDTWKVGIASWKYYPSNAKAAPRK
jgi:hypothetical protein